jgi:hypothetical protein
MESFTKSHEPRKYRGFGKIVYEYIKNSPKKTIKNHDMAEALGCDVRTIIRWTHIMAKEGVLIKKAGPSFCGNEYTIPS